VTHASSDAESVPTARRTVLVLRTLIVAGLVLAIVGSSIDMLIPDLIPAVLEDAWEAYISQDPSWIFIAIGGGLTVIVFVAAIVATIGLLLLRRWARPLALWTTVVSVLTYPALGAMLYSGWALMLTESAMIMWGAALAITYFSELKTHFER
jgi:urea transporter